jgi:hypothetical protein
MDFGVGEDVAFGAVIEAERTREWHDHWIVVGRSE